MAKPYVIGIAGVFVGMLLFGLIQGGITGNTILEEERLIIHMPEIADFLHDDQGAVTFSFTFPNANFKVEGKDADMLMFLDSKTVEGISIAYDLNEQKIHAGMPIMISEPVVLVDGNPHEIVYMFHKEQGRQALFLDGDLLVESDFEETNVPLTGYAIRSLDRYEAYDLGIQARFE